MSEGGLPKHFVPEGLDAKWDRAWESGGRYASEPVDGRDSYSIVLPPPNVTGTLHMGHAFQHTLMDALVRRERMCGRNVLWQPGVDHAGIATQIVVTRELERKGIDPASLTREELLAHIWKWKEESGSTITNQMRRLGASCDWTRERFTMDEGLSKVVVDVFVRLHREGLIYRGKRMVNWDPVLLTAVSDLEVVAEEEPSKLYHVRYPFVEGTGHVVIATTRPETILADGAIAVHPDDENNMHLVGRWVFVPMTDRRIQVIADGFVDPSFGSGRVKITAGHDFNDYACSQRHPQIPLIVMMTPDARLNENTPPAYQGLDRFEARKRIVRDLEEAGLLERAEDHRHAPPRGDRSGAVLEPMLTDQWFVRAKELAPAALGLVRKGDLKFIPGNWRAVYEQWLENIDDWCISRQLVWGHRIPAWHASDGTVHVAHNEEEAREAAGSGDLERDPDVLDTWFSSALWPFSTLGWPAEDNAHFRSYFPTSTLVTGFDIIFFWVARMAMMSCRLLGKPPFREVYITGLVRDAHGEKMSKSKGNTLDPLDLIDGIGLEDLVEKRTQGLMNPKLADSIAERTRADYPEGIPAFGADALRMTFASYASYGRDIKFDLNRCGGYRGFCNKLWNAARYVLSTAEDDASGGDAAPSLADRWIGDRLQQAEAAVGEAFAEYRFDLASQAIYKLVWDEYCSWYLEVAKIQIRRGGAAQARAARRTLLTTLECILRLAHPLAPFITEELWQKIAPLAAGADRPESIMAAAYPKPDPLRADPEAAAWMDRLKELVEGCRQLLGELDVARSARVEVWTSCSADELGVYEPWFSELAGVAAVHHGISPGPDLLRFTAAVGEIGLRAEVDRGESLAKLVRRRARLEQNLAKLVRKLDNADFVAHAPEEVVDLHRARRSQIERELAALGEQQEALQTSVQ